MTRTAEHHLHQPEVLASLLGRLKQLAPTSQRQWGQMDAAQMLAHVTANLELAMGTEKVRQTLEGRLFGWLARRKILRDGLPKGIPTDARRKITDQRNFEQEKARLEGMLRHFFESGPAGITTQPHVFFGRMTPHEWVRLQYLHTDHHFRQFSV